MSREILQRTLRGTVGDIAFTGIFDNVLLGSIRERYNPNMHEWYEINIVYDGEYYLEGLNGIGVGPLTKGDIVLISPGYYHQEKKNEDTTSVLYKLRFEISNHVTSDTVEKLYDMLCLELKSLGHGIFQFRLPNGIRYFDEVLRCLAGDETGRIANAEAMFKMFMTEFFMEIMHLKRSEFKAEESPVGRKEMIDRFLEENYTNSNLTAEMMAKHLSLSIRQMNRIVSGYYGVPFYQLLTGIRLNHAKKLLVSKTMTVKDVAFRVGYDSATGFFVAFKKKFGITPGEFCREEGK